MPAPDKELLIFDLDDTLIDTSDVYWRAKEKFINTLLANTDGLKKEFVDKVFEETDTGNLQNYGHSPERYGKSMHDTYLKLIKDNYLNHDPLVEQEIINAGNIILDKMPQLIDGALELLKWCKDKFDLALITRGEEYLQEKKIRHFSLQDYFEVIRIVSRKTEDDFKEIMALFKVSRKYTWIIGDSLKAEIETGLKLEANCIFFNYTHLSYNWIQERNYSITSSRSFYKADTLAEIKVILEKHVRLKK